ncbi:selenide, water dikinase [Calderihabitans maritimus]|uniref:Selenide, water dikinase n=2 Tax=Calderihabitans maritimus TaxID=1246530 RepID=A0A1Z5HX96_9FIRM|nr:selenide, water dikinase [Calderihabitans maritimus]
MCNENLLVGTDTSDDAGVYRLNDEIAIIQTVDFFTPVVDDPYLFGQIAAANSLSDVYAMGGRPLTAMNVTCFPTNKLDLGVLEEILRGGADKVLEAGAVLVGGHTVEDKEPKYGLSVTGVVDPRRVITNKGAQPGDKLILTKPLGTGIITTALKGGILAPEVLDRAVGWMVMLNDKASMAMQEVETHACTDITGFGLLGHAAEMASASGVGMRLFAGQVPVYQEALELAEQGIIPGGAFANRNYLGERVVWDRSVPQSLRDVFYDPQTSGGLLIAVPGEIATKLVALLKEYGITVAGVIGEIVADHPGSIYVEP